MVVDLIIFVLLFVIYLYLLAVKNARENVNMWLWNKLREANKLRLMSMMQSNKTELALLLELYRITNNPSLKRHAKLVYESHEHAVDLINKYGDEKLEKLGNLAEFDDVLDE